MNKADFIAGAVAIALVFLIMSITGCAVGSRNRASFDPEVHLHFFSSRGSSGSGGAEVWSEPEGGAQFGADAIEAVVPDPVP